MSPLRGENGVSVFLKKKALQKKEMECPHQNKKKSCFQPPPPIELKSGTENFFPWNYMKCAGLHRKTMHGMSPIWGGMGSVLKNCIIAKTKTYSSSIV